MNKVTIEFFHDAICSFCFPMSYRMRQIEQTMPEVEIIHRSFALVKEDEDFDVMFGSRESAKYEVLAHWEHANQNDDLHRFNIDGMNNASFPFPSSIKPLKACKAAYCVGGDDAYWEVFDALQKGFFVESKNIGDEAVIEKIIKETKIDFDKWKNNFCDEQTITALEKDFHLANKYGIDSVPSLILNGTHLFSGAQPLEQIINAINAVSEIATTGFYDGSSCRFIGNKIECD